MRQPFIALLLAVATTAVAQRPFIAPDTWPPAITVADLDSAAEWSYQRPLGQFLHPDGHPMTVVAVSDARTGKLRSVAMRHEDAQGMEVGELIDIVVSPTIPIP